MLMSKNKTLDHIILQTGDKPQLGWIFNFYFVCLVDGWCTGVNAVINSCTNYPLHLESSNLEGSLDYNGKFAIGSIFIQAGHPLYCSSIALRLLGVVLLPLDVMLVHHKFTPSNKFAGSHLYIC